MSSLLPSPSLLWAFSAASLLLAVTPGPGVLYIVTRSVTQGRAVGLASVAGVATGNLANALIAAFGLAAVLAVSAVAYSIVKYAGAIYLIYLGVVSLRSTRATSAANAPAVPPAGPKRAYVEGALVAMFNPKTALFFAAFLPQFVGAGPPSIARTVSLGVLFVFIAATSDTLYALSAEVVGPWLRRGDRGRWARYVPGSIFVALGLLASFTGRRPAP
jgi:threonine/homoserine/homoserine lactone efflux protein